MSRILQIHPDDNVAVALEPLKAGEVVETSAGTVTLREDIPQGHKLALTDIPAGATVVKYGFPIGHATQAIHVGDWVHSHDLPPPSTERPLPRRPSPSRRNQWSLPPAPFRAFAAREAWASAMRSGSFPPWAVSTAWPKRWHG